MEGVRQIHGSQRSVSVKDNWAWDGCIRRCRFEPINDKVMRKLLGS